MKINFIILLLAIGLTAKAQITLEYTHDSASVGNNNVCLIYYMKFELLGEKIVNENKAGKSIRIYNLDHSLYKKISYANFPQAAYGFPALHYLSQTLFNTDNLIEFMYCYRDVNNIPHTYIYNENGNCLFSADSLYPYEGFSSTLTYIPIFNTSSGTKMILSHQSNNSANVYSLPGVLSTAIAEVNNNLIMTQKQTNVSNAYPNPTNNTTRIDYELPNGTNEGVIVLYNSLGFEIKRYNVDRTFSTLLISTSDITAGTYYYQLRTTGQNSEGKKLIVIK